MRLRELPRVRPDALPRIRNREGTRQPFFLEPFGATTSTRGTTRWMKACQLLPGIAYEHLTMYHYQNSPYAACQPWIWRKDMDWTILATGI